LFTICIFLLDDFLNFILNYSVHHGTCFSSFPQTLITQDHGTDVNALMGWDKYGEMKLYKVKGD